MTLTPEEKEDIKAMLQFLVEKKAAASGGHSGFHETDLKPFLEELAEENKISKRATIAVDRYYLINN